MSEPIKFRADPCECGSGFIFAGVPHQKPGLYDLVMVVRGRKYVWFNYRSQPCAVTDEAPHMAGWRATPASFVRVILKGTRNHLPPPQPPT